MRWLAALFLVALPLPAQVPNGLPPSLSALMESYGALGARELAALARGDVAVLTVQTSDKDEVALVGVFAAPVPRAFYATHVWEIAGSLERPQRAAGLVHDPATPADFDQLSFSDGDAKSMRKCRPLHCPFKLSAGQMAQMSRAVNESPDPRAALDSAMRSFLAERVNDYRARGDSSLLIFDDTRLGERSSDGFAHLLEDAPILREAPGVAEYLRGPPRAGVPGIESAIYWTLDHPDGSAAIAGVVQRVLFTPTDARAPLLLITKQLYANHYFDARLDITALADAPTEAEPETYALVVRRLKFDKLPSGGMFDVRGRIIRRLRTALHDELTETRSRLEMLYRSRSP
jgi:hypothetical protein